MQRIFYIKNILICLSLALSRNAPGQQQTWTKLPSLPEVQITALAADNDIFYAATNGGIYKSTDLGETWAYVEGSADPMYSHVFGEWAPQPGAASLAVDGSRIAAVFPHFFIEDFALQLSSDGGASWRESENYVGPSGSAAISKKEMAISGDTVAVVANGSLGISTDLGQTWTGYADGSDVYQVELAQGRCFTVVHNSGIFSYDLTGENESYYNLPGVYDILVVGDVIVAVSSNKLHITTDGGFNWIQRNIPTSLNYFGGYASCASGGRIYVRPKLTGPTLHTDDLGLTWQTTSGTGFKWNRTTEIVAAGDVILSADSTHIYRSVDAGDSFFPVSGFNAAPVTAFNRLNNHCFAITVDGFHVSHDTGLSWEKVLDNPFSDYSKAGQIVVSDSAIMAVTAAGIIASRDSGKAWATMPFVPLLYDYLSLNQQLSFADGVWHVLSWDGIAQSPKLARSSDNGENWEFLDLPSGEGSALSTEGGTLMCASIFGECFRSDDHGDTWDAVPPPQNSWGLTLVKPISGKIYALQENQLYGQSAGDVWEPLHQFYFPAYSDTLPLAPSVFQEHQGKLYIGFRGEGLFVSPDSGSTWALLPGQPEAGAFASAWFGDTSMMISTMSGIYTSESVVLPPVDDQYIGKVFLDNNLDASFGLGDTPVQNAILWRGEVGDFSSTDHEGLFRFPLSNEPTDTVFLQSPLPHSQILPASRPLGNPGNGHDFAVQIIDSVADSRLSCVNSWPAKPGFEIGILLSYQNIGTKSTSAMLEFTPDANFQWLGSSVPPTSTVGNKRIWDIADLPIFGSGSIYVNLKLPATAAVGTALTNMAQLQTTHTDANPSDNTADLNLTVVASYDPNDKSALPAGKFTPQMVAAGKEITYTVRFQNVGNASADLVRIADTLDLDFDIASLQILAASHPVSWTLRGTGVLEFLFENIDLPDAGSDEPGSHGFVTYSLKPRKSLKVGDSLSNTAHIYFDFNDPIVTNTVVKVIVETIGASSPPDISGLSISPSPASDFVYVEWGKPVSGLVEVLDLQGRSVWQGRVNSDVGIRVPVKNLSAGTYQIRVQDGRELKSGLFVKN